MLLIAALRSRGEIRSSMGDGVRPIGPHIGDVLDQRALEVNVEDLAAITNGQHRLRRVKRMSENGFVGVISIRVQGRGLGVPRCTIAAGVHVRRTAGQDKSVQFLQLAGKLFRGLFERNFERFGAGFSDRPEIEVQFLALPGALFLGGAPRDAHTRAVGGAQMRISKGHGTPNRSIRTGGQQPEEG